jgi:hypothetical protein
MRKQTKKDLERYYLEAMEAGDYFPTAYEALIAFLNTSKFSVYFDLGAEANTNLTKMYYSWLSPYAGGNKWLSATEREALIGGK